MAAAPTRVSIYAGRAEGTAEQQPQQYDRQILLDALMALPGDTTAVRSSPLGESSGASGSAGSSGNQGASGSTLEKPPPEEVDVEDNEVVFITEAYKEWEGLYLKRLAKRIHRLVCQELTRSEEALFMLFTTYDENLDGVVRGDEASRLVEAIEEAAPGAADAEDVPLQEQDSSISFVSLLKWYSGDMGDDFKETTARFNLTSLLTGFLGSGMLQNDSRLEALSNTGLRRSIVGYRRLLTQLRQLREERVLAAAREVESSVGLEDAMPEYYKILAQEFDGDAEHLFELFCEADEAGQLQLESQEVETLLRLLDTGATEADLKRYITEINLTDGPLTFASLIDWWDQARSVPNSLVAEKGATLLASVKAQAARRSLGGIFGETAAQRRWAEAKEAGQLQALRQAYCRTYSEVREYKIERDLRNAETDCARL